jgi:uncharacterized NAD-dependent epimerase/dehydratase family protein
MLTVISLPADSKLALLMHGELTGMFGKMGLGLLRYSQQDIVAIIDRTHTGEDVRQLTGIPRPVPIVSSVEEAIALGSETLVIAIAPSGGILPDDYRAEVIAALDAGMSLVNGLHEIMAESPDMASRLKSGRFIWDVRREPPNLISGTGAAAKLTNRRVLTVGTDMAIGKMTASLEMEKAALARGIGAKFLASGQIGICISGEGVPLDGVRVDFASGSIEQMILRHADTALLLIEGQGSLLHPGSTAWLPLMRGSQPTHLILCHRAGQKVLSRLTEFPIPHLKDVIALCESVSRAAGVFSEARVVGISLNCAHLNDDEARRAVDEVASETNLPTTDPIRFGAEILLEAIAPCRFSPMRASMSPQTFPGWHPVRMESI